MEDDKMNTIICVGFTIFVLTLLVFYVSVVVKYANVPVSEMPTWVWWLLQGGKK